MMPLIKAKLIINECDDMLNASVDKALREVVDHFVEKMIDFPEMTQHNVSIMLKGHMKKIVNDKLVKIDNML